MAMNDSYSGHFEGSVLNRSRIPFEFCYLSLCPGDCFIVRETRRPPSHAVVLKDGV